MNSSDDLWFREGAIPETPTSPWPEEPPPAPPVAADENELTSTSPSIPGIPEPAPAPMEDDPLSLEEFDQIVQRWRREERRDWWRFLLVMSVCSLLWLGTWVWYVLRDTPTTTASPVVVEPAMALALPPSPTVMSPPMTLPSPPSPPASTARHREQRPAPATRPRRSPSLLQAYEAFSRKDLDRAESLYIRLLQHADQRRGALLGLAMVALKRGHQVEAAAYYHQVLLRSPRDDEASAGLLAAYSAMPRDAAREALRSAIAESPDVAWWHYVLGSLSLLWGDQVTALEHLRQAVRLRPGHGDALYNLAVACDRDRRGQEAIAFYQRALDRAPGAHFDQEPVRQRLRQLRDLP